MKNKYPAYILFFLIVAQIFSYTPTLSANESDMGIDSIKKKQNTTSVYRDFAISHKEGKIYRISDDAENPEDRVLLGSLRTLQNFTMYRKGEKAKVFLLDYLPSKFKYDYEITEKEKKNLFDVLAELIKKIADALGIKLNKEEIAATNTAMTNAIRSLEKEDQYTFSNFNNSLKRILELGLGLKEGGEEEQDLNIPQIALFFKSFETMKENFSSKYEQETYAKEKVQLLLIKNQIEKIITLKRDIYRVREFVEAYNKPQKVLDRDRTIQLCEIEYNKKVINLLTLKIEEIRKPENREDEETQASKSSRINLKTGSFEIELAPYSPTVIRLGMAQVLSSLQTKDEETGKNKINLFTPFMVTFLFNPKRKRNILWGVQAGFHATKEKFFHLFGGVALEIKRNITLGIGVHFPPKAESSKTFAFYSGVTINP